MRADSLPSLPTLMRLSNSLSMAPLSIRTAGSRTLIMRPLISSGFPIRTTRLAQLVPNNPPAAPVENPPGLQVPVGPAVENPATPNPPDAAPADNPPATPVTPGEGTPVTPGEGTPVTPTDTTPDTVNPDFEGRNIAEVRVVGNRIVDEPTILLQAGSQRGSALSSKQLELDRAKIDAIGLFASVQYQVTQNLEDPAKVDVAFIVIENRVVRNIKFEGTTQIPVADLQKVLASKTGAVLDRANVNKDVEAIQGLYREKGFAAIVLETRQTEDGSLIFVLQEGRIAKVEFSGLKKTRPELIRKQVRTKSGDSFDQTRIREDLNRIYDMGFFEDVSYKVADDPDSKQGAIIVTIVVKEKRTGQLSLGVGFDNRSKISGFATVGEQNFRGTGTRVSASVELGSRRTFELGYGNPFVGKKNASYDFSVFNRVSFREPRSVARIAGVNTGINQTFQFEEKRTGFRGNFTLPQDINRTKSFLVGARIEKARLSQTDLNGTIVPVNLPTDASGSVTAFSVGFLRDKRDLRLDPSRGGREQFIVEQGVSLLGGSNFTKLDLDLRRYIPLIGAPKIGELPKMVLAGRVVVGRSFGQLPAFEQYFIGGSDTVRGYEADEQFGDNQFYSNLELRYRLQRKFTIVGFADVGQSSGGRFSSQNAQTLYSVGAGVRVTTPVGPVRLDLAFGRNGVRTHFSISQGF